MQQHDWSAEPQQNGNITSNMAIKQRRRVFQLNSTRQTAAAKLSSNGQRITGTGRQVYAMLAAIGIGLVCCAVHMLWCGVWRTEVECGVWSLESRVWSPSTIDSLVTRLNIVWQRPENTGHLSALKATPTIARASCFSLHFFFVSLPSTASVQVVCGGLFWWLVTAHAYSCKTAAKQTKRALPSPSPLALGLGLRLELGWHVLFVASDCKSTHTRRHFWALSWILLRNCHAEYEEAN